MQCSVFLLPPEIFVWLFTEKMMKSKCSVWFQRNWFLCSVLTSSKTVQCSDWFQICTVQCSDLLQILCSVLIGFKYVLWSVLIGLNMYCAVFWFVPMKILLCSVLNGFNDCALFWLVQKKVFAVQCSDWFPLLCSVLNWF